MPEPQWKSDFRRQLEKAGEIQVRTEFHTLATGGEDRLCFWSIGSAEKSKSAKRAKTSVT
jgi:hypothetical protein